MVTSATVATADLIEVAAGGIGGGLHGFLFLVASGSLNAGGGEPDRAQGHTGPDPQRWDFGLWWNVVAAVHRSPGMDVDRNGLRILDRDECLRRLQASTIGRVGVSSAALPTVLPVNFLLDGDRILIRTGEGTKLANALRESVVAFEVDEFDPVDHTGWSVVVTGISRVVADEDDLRRIDDLPLAHWAPSNGQVMAIATDLISGRELGNGARHSA